MATTIFTRGFTTIPLAAGDTIDIAAGYRSFDLINTGTGIAYFTGSTASSLPVPVPAGYTYCMEFSDNGWDAFSVDNSANDSVLGIVLKS